MARRDEASRTISAQISKSLPGILLLSTTRVGTDDSGNTIYKIAFKPMLPPGTHGGGPGIQFNPRTTQATQTKTITLHNGKIRAPQMGGSGIPPGGRRGQDTLRPSRRNDADLRAMKDKWFAKIAENVGVNISESTAEKFRDVVRNFSGNPGLLNSRMDFLLASNVENIFDQEGGEEFNFDDLFGSIGGGGGGGFTGPEYVKPDERVVEDFVKGTMISLVGAIDDGLVESLKSTYMTDHRRNFDNPNQEIDPSQSVLEQLRQTDQYEEIHALRPDSEDERRWISQRRQAAAQGGLTVGGQQDFAIQQATVGGDLPDVADAGAFEQFQSSGSARGTLLEDKIRGTATNLFRGVA